MKPSGVNTSFFSRGLDLFSKRLEKPESTEPTVPVTVAKSESQESSQPDPQQTDFFRRQAQKAEAAASRSKLKTRRLVELCAQVRQGKRQSDDWFVKHEKFFHSPVWKLVRDEALLKAHYQCEYWGCAGRAKQVQLLEFPAEHLEPNFNWMKRNDILIALCSRHYDILHGFVMKRVFPSDRQHDSIEPRLPSSVLAHSTEGTGAALAKQA